MTTATLESIYNQVNADFLSLGIRTGNVTKLSWNGRFKNVNGRCKRRGDEYQIEISKMFLDRPDEVRKTMAHEILHTVDGCFNHGDKFHELAQTLKKCGYNITTKRHVDYTDDDYPYVMECNCCGSKVRNFKKTDFFKNPNRWICGRCKNSDWKRIK